MLQYQQSENDELRKLIAYLERFRECVSYGYFRDQDWPVGSGRKGIAFGSLGGVFLAHNTTAKTMVLPCYSRCSCLSDSF